MLKLSKTKLIAIVVCAYLLSSCNKQESTELIQPLPTPEVVEQESPQVPTVSVMPTTSPLVSIKPKTSVSPKPKASPTPPATTFDLNLENITLSTSPNVAEPSWHGVIAAKSAGHFDLERRSSAYAASVKVRNNGQEPALEVTYELIIDDVSTRVIKDRIDQGTSHSIRIGELPNDDKRHTVRVNISSAKAESNPGNNSHAFTYQIR